VPYNRILTFKIKIIKTQNKNISIGIVDEPKQRLQRYSYNSKNAVCYKGYNGRKYPSGEIQGDGFSEG
jgi:hypothetical protein